MKTYEAIYDPKKTKGVFGISLVYMPAMEGHFLALSDVDSQIKLSTVNEEKRILIGLVLEPNKPVYRNQDGEEFNVMFSENTIEELAFAFAKGGHHKNSSLEHVEKIDGVTFVESWIIEDSKNDKSAALGLSYPKGSWMATMKVDSDEVWNDYVKTGKVQGFSVDALVSLKELNFKTNIEMADEKKGIIDAIKEGFGEFTAMFKKEFKIDLGSVKTTNPDVDIMFEGDTLEIGGRVWILADDGTEVALPVGNYDLEDNKILVVAEEGKVGEVKDAPAEDPAAAPAQTAEMSASDAATLANEIKSIMIKYASETQKQINDLKATHKKEIDEVKATMLEMKAAPSRKPIHAVPAQIDLKSAKGRILSAIQEQQ